MVTLYYTIEDSPLYEFRDDYNWDLNDEMELESLFECLAFDSYEQNNLHWADKQTKVIVLRDKDGEPIKAMYAEIDFEPTFSVYGRDENELY